MASAAIQCFIFFLLHFLIPSGSSVAVKRPLEAIHENRKLASLGNRILFSPSFLANDYDTSGNIPVVNPTTSPSINPTYSPPSPPIDPIPTPATPTITSIIPTTPTTPTMSPSLSSAQWCIASPTASETALQVALDYACGYGGADCSAIQPGGSCYSPTTVRDHASYAFNDYYRKNPSPMSCVFGGTAQLSSTDPSTSSCRYPAASAATSISPPSPVIPTPTIPTPPTTATPTTPIPDGSTIYGAEPAGLPSSATSVSCSLLVLFITAALFSPFLDANYLPFLDANYLQIN